jgi:hypothetical protein
MIKRWLLDIMEHGAVPACHFSFGNRARRQRDLGRQDMTEGTKRGAWNSFCESTHINLPALRTGTRSTTNKGARLPDLILGQG